MKRLLKHAYIIYAKPWSMYKFLFQDAKKGLNRSNPGFGSHFFVNKKVLLLEECLPSLNTFFCTNLSLNITLYAWLQTYRSLVDFEHFTVLTSLLVTLFHHWCKMRWVKSHHITDASFQFICRNFYWLLLVQLF